MHKLINFITSLFNKPEQQHKVNAERVVNHQLHNELQRNISKCSQSTRPYSNASLLNELHDRYSFESLQTEFALRTGEYELFDISKLKAEESRLVHWIGSMDYSGYTREKCLTYLVDNYQAGDENRIILRLADWVIPIYSIASTWVKENFEELSLNTILENQELILYVSRKEHVKYSQAMRKICEVIEDKCEDLTNEIYLSLQPAFRKFLIVISLESSQSLRSMIITDPDPSIRLLLLKSELPLTDIEIEAYKTDPAVFIRRYYYSSQIRKGEQPSKEELIALTTEHNVWLRELARYYLKEFYSVDTYQLYKSFNNDNFYFIADFCRSEDLPFFIEGARSSNPKLRLLSLQALVKTDYTALRQLYMKALLTDNVKIRTLLYEYLPKLYSIEEIMEFRSCFYSDSYNQTIRFFMILQQISFWKFVNIALKEVLSNPDRELHRFISRAIIYKTNIYETIPENLRKDINIRIELCSDKELLPGTLEQLRFMMR